MNQDLYLIEAKCNEGNMASGKLLERLGFQKECSLRDRRIDQQTKKRTNLCICSVIQEKYLKQRRVAAQ